MAESKGLLTASALEMRVRHLAARAINEELGEIFRMSQNEVPIDAESPESGALMESGHISKEADAHSLWGEIKYGTAYGAAQHEGEADMVRGGQVVHWVVRHHTMPGRKTHFLSDPLKARTPHVERTMKKIVDLGLREATRG